jgi:sodium-dependent dicarboxylate transporter 2/3/5
MSENHADDKKEGFDLLNEIRDRVGSVPTRISRIRWIQAPQRSRYFEGIYSKRYFIICAFASLFTYFVLSGQDEMVRRVGAIFVFAAGCWLLEVFPIYITGLMIPVALTLTGVYSPSESFSSFANPVIFLLLGGLVIGQSFRKYGLDKRLAYSVLLRSKGNLDRIVLLLMLVTAFLSMWMSNTVAVAILLPVALTILASVPDKYRNFKKKMLIGMTASATLGGMAMLTGSTPNMIAAAFLAQEGEFGYMHWAYYGVPVVLATLAISYLVLKKAYPSPSTTLDIEEVRRQSKELGEMNSKQRRVIQVFILTICLWFFGSEVEILLGLPASVSSAAIVSILAVLIMFGLDLLDLRDMTSVQWEIMFLVGGGIMLGYAMMDSGAAAAVGNSIVGIGGAYPVVLMLLAFIGISIAMTNFISNSATAAILIPISMEVARALEFSPVPFVMAVALASSVAFITPIGTPSTALVYSTGLVDKKFLVKNGLLLGAMAALIILIFVWALPVP